MSIQSNAKIRKKLTSWHQHQEPSKENELWGWIKLHNQFDELSADSTNLSQKILKISINYENLLSAVKNLLDAPQNVNYTLFLRNDSCFKNNEMFAGEFLIDKNLGYLKNSFLIDLMPSPENYARKLVSKYNENNEDTETAMKIFELFNHSTFMFHLKNEFGFNSMILFLLHWLPRAGDSWPWYKWNFNRFFQLANENDWKAIDDKEESSELILMQTFNNVNSNKGHLFDVFLKLLNCFFEKCPKLTSKFLKMIDLKFIETQLPKASLSNYCQMIDLFIDIYENSDEETQLEIEKSMNQDNFYNFFASAVLANSKRHNSKLQDKLYQIQQIRFAEIRRFLRTSVGFDNAAELDSLIREQYPDQIVDDIVDLISTSPPGYYLFEAIYSLINRDVDEQLVLLLDEKQMSMDHFIKMAINVLNFVFESISTKEHPFEPTYHSILVFEQNPIAWMFKNGCLIFKDIWSSDKMQFEPNLRFYKTSQILKEILKKTIETQPATLNEWSERLQQNFMIKWLCNGVEEMDAQEEREWTNDIQEAMEPSIKELIRKKYIGYLHQGFVFKKYITVKKADGHRIETSDRKWVLDRGEIAFRVYNCDVVDKLKSQKLDDNEDEANAPELILAVKSITRIIQGEEYSEKCKVLFPPSKRKIFRKDKNQNIPNGIFIETANEEHEILYDNAEEFQKFIAAFNILRFNSYPNAEVDKLLKFETKMRLLNLKNADVWLGQDFNGISLPNLPTII